MKYATGLLFLILLCLVSHFAGLILILLLI